MKRIRVEFSLHDYEMECGGCDKELWNKEDKLHLTFVYKVIVLCPDCLRDLRVKIDALTLLVQKGRDTK